MSAQRPRPEETGRSTGRVLLDIILIAAIPTVIIFIISRLWH
jgi:hypothetical protein